MCECKHRQAHRHTDKAHTRRVPSYINSESFIAKDLLTVDHGAGRGGDGRSEEGEREKKLQAGQQVKGSCVESHLSAMVW